MLLHCHVKMEQHYLRANTLTNNACVESITRNWIMRIIAQTRLFNG